MTDNTKVIKSQTKFKVALVNADNYNGGAARATRRIAKGLTALKPNGIKLELICNGEEEAGYKKIMPTYNSLSTYYLIPHLIGFFKRIASKLWKFLILIDSNNKRSFFRVSNSINHLKTFEDYDLIHIFWGQTFINPKEIENLNKPIIITMHDMWFITGGCAFSFDCKGYIFGCKRCPYVRKLFHKNITNQYKLKHTLLRSPNTKIVVSSDWMEGQVRAAGINPSKIIKILNYIPQNFQYKSSKEKIRFSLSWRRENINKKILYFVGDINDPRKGFDIIIEALRGISKNLKELVAIQVLGCSNSVIESLDNIGIEYNSLGFYSDEKSQINAYNAADLLLCTSRFDNTPNVIAEAQMCGLPTLAFANTGAAEMIEENISGIISNDKNIKELEIKITQFILGYIKFDSVLVSKWAKSKYGSTNTCSKYIKIYESVLIDYQ